MNVEYSKKIVSNVDTNKHTKKTAKKIKGSQKAGQCEITMLLKFCLASIQM